MLFWTTFESKSNKKNLKTFCFLFLSCSERLFLSSAHYCQRGVVDSDTCLSVVRRHRLDDFMVGWLGNPKSYRSILTMFLTFNHWLRFCHVSLFLFSTWTLIDAYLRQQPPLNFSLIIISFKKNCFPPLFKYYFNPTYFGSL